MRTEDTDLFGWGFVGTIIFVWLLCAACATGVGPTRYGGRLFVLTFLFMGPLGIAAALIMKAIEDYAAVPSAGALPVATTPPPQKYPLKVGDRVKVKNPRDDYHGKVGVVDEITDEQDGYNIYVAFGDDPQTRAFGGGELSVVRAAAPKPKANPTGK